MGHYVHLSVVMACYNNEPVAEIAKKYVGKMDKCFEAEWFIDDLSKRTGINTGPKGGLSFWGIVGNYTCAEHFCDCLRPFWKELFEKENHGSPFDFEHIIVFSEHEQSEQAEAHEISYNNETKEVEIKYHILPFAWMQM